MYQMFLLSFLPGFFRIGFLEVDVIDIADILIVAFLMYQLYRLLKGTLAFNIFIGIVIIYFAWFLVKSIGMQLLSGILGQFLEVGGIVLLIVFQPEIRKFLLFLGKENPFTKGGSFFRNLMKKKDDKDEQIEHIVEETSIALEYLQTSNTGAILVFTDRSKLINQIATGTPMESQYSAKLVESIFNKNSPLHDGAVIVTNYKIVAAGCVLPVSENPDLPPRAGLRHKASVGITEETDALSVVVSEETGFISYARHGRINTEVTIQETSHILRKFLQAVH